MGETAPIRAQVAAALADAVVAVVLAPVCAACDRPLERPLRGAVCGACWASVATFSPPFCDTCGDPLPSWRVLSLAEGRCVRCRRKSGAIALARAVGPYDGALRTILHAFKYGGRRSLARPLGALMRARGREVLAGADVLVPVPLHLRRRLVRGFNQADALAQCIGLPVVRAVRRTRNTPSQTDLPEARRHANVRGAFRRTRGARVDGACVVLIDDVSTTGATLDACARTLREAGAREVRALTAARVVSRPR